MSMVWDLLSAEAIGKLFAFQMEHHGLKLTDPHEPVRAVTVAGEVEPPEEVEKLMRQAPSRSRGS
ncbi:hypothetical protein LCGC14_0513760 [marine sediment metagenome]|uniref:Uncharacterized protein n=1 Tax=marine sediment metagenome TaxID=412755 RepID=A0A0F9S583_9ZZZZ